MCTFYGLIEIQWAIARMVDLGTVFIRLINKVSLARPGSYSFFLEGKRGSLFVLAYDSR